MPDTVIAAVEAKALSEGQPLLIKKCPVFEWAPSNPITTPEDQITDPDIKELPSSPDSLSVSDDASVASSHSTSVSTCY